MAYGRVEETFWRDGTIRSLSEDGRNFMLYLLTCPHKNRLGLFVLDPLYAAADLQWDPARANQALEELIEADRIQFDQSSGILFVKRFLKHNTIENANVVKGAIRELGEIPDTPLFHSLLTALEEWSRPHYDKLLQAVRNRCPNRSPNGSVNDCPRERTRSVTSTLTEEPTPKPPSTANSGFSPEEDQPEVEEGPPPDLEEQSDGSDWIHPSKRLTANQVLEAWESKQPIRVPEPERRRQRHFARAIADHHTVEEVAAAFVGMGLLFPHCPPKNEPWDLRDLDQKFAKAMAKARDHPDLRARDFEADFHERADEHFGQEARA